MSYLPRLSKTYKEPQETFFEDLEETLSLNTLKPASSLLNEKTFNPQMILRHYKYLPHAPPVLPGPSVLEELREHELYKEASRMRRSTSKTSKTEEPPKPEEVAPEPPPAEETECVLPENEDTVKAEEKTKRSRKCPKSGKPGIGRKKSIKSIKRNSSSKVSVNMCLLPTGKLPLGLADPKARSAFGDSESVVSDGSQPRRVKSLEEQLGSKSGELISRGVQCAIFGNVAKAYVIPQIIYSLLRTLGFLLREMNKEEHSNLSGEKKTFLTQIQLILGDLCTQKVEKEYGYDMTYSDFKRLEKILGELQKYMRDVYGDKGEYIDKMEDLKQIFIQLKKKEMELAFLTEKMQEMEGKTVQEVVVKEADLKNSEIILQNKRLESEQLTAEAEFSCRELRECQKSIAEVEWEIREFQEQIHNLKKTAAPKSKSGILARKSSILKCSTDVTARGSKEVDKKKS